MFPLDVAVPHKCVLPLAGEDAEGTSSIHSCPRREAKTPGDGVTERGIWKHGLYWTHTQEGHTRSRADTWLL